MTFGNARARGKSRWRPVADKPLSVRSLPVVGTVLVLLSLGLCASSAGHAAQPGQGATELGTVSPPSAVDAQAKPIRRFPDPVIILGETLPPEWVGTEIRSILVFSLQGDRLLPIRFQVDERTEGGDWIFPHGKKRNGWKSNGRLDPQDVILFMAKDAGEMAEDLSVLPGSPRVLPVELRDPVHGGAGWVYLASFAGARPPGSLLPHYVHYDADREIISSAYTRAEYLITEDGLHTSFYTHHSTPPEAGGTGQNLVDRLKFRVFLRFFNLVSLTLQEERLGSDVVAYIEGPVRVLRRVEQFVKLPFGIRGVRTYADVDTYECFATVPIHLHIPRGFRRVVSSANLRFGTDYSPHAIGSFFRNSEISEALIIDGRMSEAEERLPKRRDQWRIFYGPYGVLMTRVLYPPELLEMVEIRQGYVDDLKTPMPEERYPGSIGYAYTEIHAENLRAGRYRIVLDFYFPPHYRPGDETRFLHLRDHPLRIRIGDRETENPQHLHAEEGGDIPAPVSRRMHRG